MINLGLDKVLGLRKLHPSLRGALIQPTYSDKINHLRGAAALWIFVFHYYHFIAHSFFAPLNSLNPFLLLVYHGYFFVYLFLC